ncbi:hypothetical protein [Devosia psychrophila]|uniref:Uncharacterized protein n=1 Tax=Devosia psychrophila TaxID=728005 RepID=A0A1I1RZQ1_9HYPH|nr:hypothetical protein [Devosia psychrophila]SFD05283.1 hypothetical protein SAMN04488059_1191 [Devosia psychrophila]SFD39786.1 hypothetical protein SAMN04488059_1522 [Devosia psychrophila]SFD40645.1 hypothetical protein SAMN04488059_15318 [Devosia psychrophila]
MADHFYCRDKIRRNLFLDISGSAGINGWSGVCAMHNACLVDSAR